MKLRRGCVVGVGCYYTLKNYNTDGERIRAYWVEIDSTDYPDYDTCFDYEELIYEIISTLRAAFPKMLGDCHNDNEMYYGENFKIILESTYYGDGIIINFEIIENGDEPHWALIQYNYERCYDKIVRAVNKSFALRIATSGFTSQEIPQNHLT